MLTSEDEDYSVSPQGYLDRAARCLASADRAMLFYAALELRCCVEARQDMYLDAQREYARSVPDAWMIGKQASALRRIFNSDQIVEVALKIDDNEATFFYVPVSKELRSLAERLGNYLHSKVKYHKQEDLWWIDLRETLLKTYRLAWQSCQGRLLCPPLMKNNKMVGTLAIDVEGLNDRSVLDLMSSKGKQFYLKIDYRDIAPPEWLCPI